MANENLDRLRPFDLMCKLISFPTVSCETNLPLVDWVESYLHSHGISAHRWTDPDQPHNAALFAHVGPEIAGAIVLSGHTDVVPIDGQNWETNPWEVVEKRWALLWPSSICFLQQSARNPMTATP